MLVDNDNDFAESECPSCACAVARRRYLHRVQEQKGGRGIEDMMLLEMAKGKNWKRCPKCEFFVEKRDGCLHVTCRLLLWHLDPSIIRLDLSVMLKEVLDAFLAPGSGLWMFNDVPEVDRERKLIDGGLDFSRLDNITLVHREGNAVIRHHLESLPLESFDSILILADESVEDSAIQAESRSLATLLLIRDIQAKRLTCKESLISHVPRGTFSEGSWIGEMQQASDKYVIISEILDPRTKNLLSVSKISDYVLSNELVSMALAMVAEDRQINNVLEELFAE
ncbi:Ion channel CASTOR [Zea mays]|uniref:Ion channel CASTOR n=1 Tax=Zea mays TaxID=4577 RepID=A0A1D6ML73_MAIZE|nr:Ion channel CASTOR [Zea mays]